MVLPPKQERTLSPLEQIAQTFRIPFSILEFEIQIPYQIPSDDRLGTRSEEWDAICALATRDGPRIGMMLDLLDLGNMIALRESALRGRIGSVQSVVLTGLHPLLYGTRPAWYFEPGMQGGTLCDIAAHVMDFLPWLTGFDIAAVEYARTWNAKAAATPGVEDCAQFVMRLENGAGVIGDVSYLAPVRWALDLQSHADRRLP